MIFITIFIGCSEDNLVQDEELNTTTFDLKEYEITQDDIEKIKSLDFNTSDLRLVEKKKFDGTDQKYYIVEGDIWIPQNEVNRLISSKSDTKQYHANNVVDNYKTITVRGVNTGPEALSGSQRTQLSLAIQNYNDLDIGLTFVLTFGNRDNSKDINATQISINVPGGIGDYPSAGNPGPEVKIFSRTRLSEPQVVRHIWMHELGHTLGLRHTDWFSRQSCNSTPNPEDVNSPSNPNSNGTNHIPGTPTGFDPTSLMLACFDTEVPGEFGAHDITALEYLFPSEKPINGPSVICNNTSTTYTLQNIGSVNWITSSNLQIISSSNNSITVRSTNSFVNGEAYIEARFSNRTLRKNIWIGKPKVPTNITFYSSSPCLNQNTIATIQDVNPDIAGAHYNWRGGGHTYVDQNPKGTEVHFTTFSAFPYTTNVFVKATNACGSSFEYAELINVIDCGGGPGPLPQ